MIVEFTSAIVISSVGAWNKVAIQDDQVSRYVGVDRAPEGASRYCGALMTTSWA
jgi:hypothetical protein